MNSYFLLKSEIKHSLLPMRYENGRDYAQRISGEGLTTKDLLSITCIL